MMTIMVLRDDARAKTESSRKVTGALLKGSPRALIIRDQQWVYIAS